MSDWISGTIGGLAGVTSTLLANRANVQMNRETNAARQQLAEWQNQQNIAQWQRENAYNLPINQMKRLREAGLNPSIMMTEGGVVNEAAQSPQMGSAAGSLTTPQIQSPLDPLTASQIALNMSQARKNDSENEYQQYMNAVERELSHVPLRTTTVKSEDGSESVEIVYGNARAEIVKTDLKRLGLSEQGLRYELADLFFDLAVKTGSYDFNSGLGEYDPVSTPGYKEESSALRGDRQVRDLAGKLAGIGYEAAQAEKAGKEEYAKWLKEHKDDPFVKFALILQGFLQSVGFTFPTVKMSGSKYGNKVSSSSWYFQN